MSRCNSSVLWKFFAKTDNANKKAKCNSCGEVYSYKTSNGNLKIHLKRKHPNAYTSFMSAKNARTQKPRIDTQLQPSSSSSNGALATGSSAEISINSDSQLLGFFTHVDDDKARCDFCEVILAADRDTLNNHLTKEHPKLVTGVQGGGEGSDSDDDGNADTHHEEEVYTEFMYLDEVEQNVSMSPKKTKRNSVHGKVKNTSKAKLSRLELDRKRLHGSNSTDDDEPNVKRLKTEPVTEDDQLQNFLNYITVLLKMLPKDVCSKLQMDIINLIMKEKMKGHENANAVKVVNLQDLANMSQIQVSEAPNILRNSAVFVIQSNTNETAANLTLNNETTGNVESEAQEATHTIENAVSQAAAPILNKLPDL